jgi:hypothetical protein
MDKAVITTGASYEFVTGPLKRTLQKVFCEGDDHCGPTPLVRILTA